MKCLQCNSDEIVKNVRAIDDNRNYKGDLRLEVYENPNALLFRGTNKLPLTANVCSDCGFVMWFVSKENASFLKDFNKKES